MPEKQQSQGLRAAIWGLVIYAGTWIVAIVLEQTSMAAVVAQAVVAEFGVGRIGVTWSDPDADPPTGGAMAKRAIFGAAIGAAAAAVTVILLVVTRAVLLVRADPSASVVVVGLVTAGLIAMRDELVLHGVAIRALGATPALVKVLACGVTSAASAIGESGSARAAVARGLLGLVFGALWVSDRGAWRAWGAHAASLFVSDLFLRGGFYEAQVAASTWGGAEAGPLGGSAAVVALLPFGAAAVVWAARLPGARAASRT